MPATPADRLAAALDAVPPDVTLACAVLHDGRPVLVRRAEEVLPAASLGKLVLLVAAARALEEGGADPAEPLARATAEPVGDSGLWQRLRVGDLPFEDVARLVAAVSDNLATNVLLDRLGMHAVREAEAGIGLGATTLLDRVRDARGPGDPPVLSRASAGELARLMDALGRGALRWPGVAARVLGWLADGVDASLVAGGLGLDPLAHAAGDRGLRLWHKTGADPGVRGDTGLVAGPGGSVAYALLARWDPAGPPRRDAVLEAARRVGRVVGDLARG